MRDSLGPFLRRDQYNYVTLAEENAVLTDAPLVGGFPSRCPHTTATRTRIHTSRLQINSVVHGDVRQTARCVGYSFAETERAPGKITESLFPLRHRLRCACGRKVNARNGKRKTTPAPRGHQVALIGANSFSPHRRDQARDAALNSKTSGHEEEIKKKTKK